jgi:pyruvate formate lyase activating enzyme
MQVVGREITAADLLAEIERDRIFFEQSGGGVTFSGGDPLAQPEFLAGLLDELAARGVHTAVDTSGFAPADVVELIARKTRLVLYDLKVMDDAKHRELTGVSNKLILENLERLAAGPAEVWVRVPLIAGVNDDPENVRATIAFLASLGKIRNVGLLPYHTGGSGKAERIGKAERLFAPPSDERYAAIEAEFRIAGFNVQKGG